MESDDGATDIRGAGVPPRPAGPGQVEGEAATRMREPQVEVTGQVADAIRLLQLAAGHGAPSGNFGRLQMRGLLGTGGMATVYRVNDPLLGRDVALKLLPASSRTPGALERFRREARSLARIRHRHIVAVHDVGESDGALWFTMDLVAGESLQQILGRHAGADPAALAVADLAPPAKELPPAPGAGSYVEAVARMFVKLADALDHAHRAGIVHRDVKPGNIMVDLAGEPHLVDFGLARGEDAATVTRTGVGPGTPGYMAPEQISGHDAVGARTDVYGLGVSLYEVLTLRRPFAGDSTEQIFGNVLAGDPPRPRRWNPRIPRDLETVCLTAIEKDPRRRYPSAAAFAEDLQSLLNLQPIRARPAGALRRARQLLRRHPVRSALVAAVALAAILIGLIGFGQRLHGRGELRASLAAARVALGEANFDAAQSCVEQALALDLESSEARELRAEIASARARLEHARALAEGRAQLAEYAARVADIRQARAVAAELEGRILDGKPEPAPLAWARAKERIAPLEVAAQKNLLAASEAFDRAERQVPGTPEVRFALADLYMARWRVDREDSAAEAYMAKVREYDVEGRHAVELDGLCSVVLEGAPAGAAVHVFQYHLLSRLEQDGEPRLVPVPFDPSCRRIVPQTETGAVAAGAITLAISRVAPRSAAERVGLRRRDLITSVAGLPVRDAVFVRHVDSAGPAARFGVAPFDRLVRVAGREVREEQHAEVAHADQPAASDYSVVFEGPAGRCSVPLRRGVSLCADLGVLLGNAAEALDRATPVRPFALDVVQDGTLRKVTLAAGEPTGIEGVLTAYPLAFGAANALVGSTDSIQLPPGSYLLVVSKEGHEDLRLPLQLQHAETVLVRARPLPEGSTPPGFLYVAPGRSIYGGDRDAIGAVPPQVTDIPGFFIARAEVTEAEYAEFLNDPATRRRIEAAAAQGTIILVPRNTLGQPRWLRQSERYVPDWDSRRPVHDIAGSDAMAYVAWRNERARAQGDPWTFTLPLPREWEKAARGADGRWYPWGCAFGWSLCASMPARGRGPLSEPVLRFLADESPYGVRDLAGGVIEWQYQTATQERGYWRGGAWHADEARIFRAASRSLGDNRRVGANDGFRLVALSSRAPGDTVRR